MILFVSIVSKNGAKHNFSFGTPHAACNSSSSADEQTNVKSERKIELISLAKSSSVASGFAFIDLSITLLVSPLPPLLSKPTILALSRLRAWQSCISNTRKASAHISRTRNEYASSAKNRSKTTTSIGFLFPHSSKTVLNASSRFGIAFA